MYIVSNKTLKRNNKF
nr:unnamed protein product [Callosobruchus analis]